MKAQWLHENIASVLAIVVLIFTIGVDAAMLFRDVKTTENLSIMIVTSVNNFAMVVLSFYFGNSQFRISKDMRK